MSAVMIMKKKKWTMFLKRFLNCKVCVMLGLVNNPFLPVKVHNPECSNKEEPF